MPDDVANPFGAGDPLLRDMSPHTIASLIRSLDSRLLGIEYDDTGGVPVLSYRFEIAGRVEVFPVLVRSPDLPSIVDLYPEAAAREQALQHQRGLTFRSPDVPGARE